MTSYLKRLVKSLAAYQVADVVSKFIAVLLLPLYTRYIPPSGYGTVELLGNGVIFVSIVVRLGIIEAFLRFYFSDADQERRDALARRAVAFLLIVTTLVAAILLLLASQLSRFVLRDGHVGIFRVAVLGLWTFTNLELAYGLLRVDERIRAYALASLTNVAITIPASVVAVVALGQGARGLLLANYGASTAVLLGLWWTMRRRLAPRRGAASERLGALLRFGLPTVPAEVSVYALSLVDRFYLYHHRSPTAAGLYSIAIKFAGVVAFLVRAFQYAWPPLAYSVSGDAEARSLYGLVTTYYALLAGWVVSGLALLGRWALRLLGHGYYGGYRAIPWVALGWAMYGLWVVFLVIAGRAKVTTRNFPAAFAGLVANVILLLVLVPSLGIAGAGVALCGAYAVMLAVMHSLTRRAFAVAFEWRRLAHLTVVIGAVTAAGDVFLPTHGTVGFLTRVAAFGIVPGALWATGFAHRQEVEGVRVLLSRVGRHRTAGEPV